MKRIYFFIFVTFICSVVRLEDPVDPLLLNSDASIEN